MTYFNFTIDKLNELTQHYDQCNVDGMNIQREYNNNQITRFKSGIKLFKNTCFINATFQCLNGCLPFVEFIFHLLEQYNSVIFQEEFELLHEYTRFMCGSTINEPGYNEQLKHLIKDVVFDTFRNFVYSVQQDLHEFLTCFLEYIDNACEMIDLIVQQGRVEVTKLDMLFNILLVNKRRCDTCDIMMKPIFEKGKFLNVPIINDKDTAYYSLTTALDAFFSVESITSRSEWVNDCETCQNTRPGTKNPYQRRYLLVEAPKVLVIQLKRFGVKYFIFFYKTYFTQTLINFYNKYDRRTNERFKIKSKIAIPIELDLNKYLAKDTKYDENYNKQNFLYDLSSIAAHYGNEVNSGHYKGN